jgi:phosphatidylglycerophosphate synthase
MENATERVMPMSRPPSHFSDAPRVLSGFLTAAEKRCLVWMAKRMPAWVTADHLTALGALAMLMAGLSYWLARWHPIGLVLVIFWLAVNWFGDSLDGTLARVRNHLRPRYGFYVDHVVDMIGQLCLVGGMGLSGYMHPLIALGLIIAFYMLSIEAYLATHTRGRFKMSFWGFGPTELRVIIAIGNIRLLFKPTATLFGHTFLLFDVGAVIAMVCMAATLVVAIVRNTRTLYLEEPLPRQAG